jgi:hypothetical protein
MNARHLKEMEGTTYMEISLHKRELAYRNAHVRVVCRVLAIGRIITKNGYIGEILTRSHG